MAEGAQMQGPEQVLGAGSSAAQHGAGDKLGALGATQGAVRDS